MLPSVEILPEGLVPLVESAERAMKSRRRASTSALMRRKLSRILRARLSRAMLGHLLRRFRRIDSR